MPKKVNYLAVLSMALLASQPLLAEEKDNKQAPDFAGEEATALEPVIVTASYIKDEKAYNTTDASTATKTDTPIIDTPFSVQVVTEEVMQDQQAYRLEDVVKNVSNMQSLPSPYSSAYETLQSRGFASEPFRDGKRIMFLTVPLANAERVEVLKGSAAIQYGRVEPGGMVNVVTKKPSAISQYEIEQQMGTDDLYRTTADLTGAINQDKTFMYRVSVESLDSNSFVDHVFDDRIFVAPSITWQPAPDTSFTLSYEYRDESEQAATGVPLINKRPADIPTSRFFGEPGLQNQFNVSVFNLSGEHAFNDNWTLRGGAGQYRGNYKYANVVNAALAADNQTLSRWGLGSDYDHRNTEDAFIDLENKFVTGSVKHTILLGTDYHQFRNYANWADWTLPDININNPVYGLISTAVLEASPVTAWWDRTDQWNGIYIQDQLNFEDKWHLLVGGRYDDTEMSSGFAGTSMADAKAAKTTKHEHEFSPKIGLVYKIDPAKSVYASYTEAFGGWANTGLTFSGDMLDPESSTQYEIGSKGEFLDRQLSASMALYELTKKNIPVDDLAHPGFSAAIGEARSRGIEFDVSGRITSGLRAIANVAISDVEITKDTFGNEGNRKANTPHSMGGAWLTYDFLGKYLNGLSVGGGVYAASSSMGDDANSFELPGYARWDTYAEYKMKVAKHDLTAQLNIYNLFDTTYYPTAQGSAQVFPGEPLRAIASIKFNY